MFLYLFIETFSVRLPFVACCVIFLFLHCSVDFCLQYLVKNLDWQKETCNYNTLLFHQKRILNCNFCSWIVYIQKTIKPCTWIDSSDICFLLGNIPLSMQSLFVRAGLYCFPNLLLFRRTESFCLRTLLLIPKKTFYLIKLYLNKMWFLPLYFFYSNKKIMVVITSLLI